MSLLATLVVAALQEFGLELGVLEHGMAIPHRPRSEEGEGV